MNELPDRLHAGIQYKHWREADHSGGVAVILPVACRCFHGNMIASCNEELSAPVCSAEQSCHTRG
jgi:hypothetical protein